MFLNRNLVDYNGTTLFLYLESFSKRIEFVYLNFVVTQSELGLFFENFFTPLMYLFKFFVNHLIIIKKIVFNTPSIYP